MVLAFGTDHSEFRRAYREIDANLVFQVSVRPRRTVRRNAKIAREYVQNVP
jgi:hypothetical protein